MPFYEYRCQRCDARFEVLRPVAEADEPTTCPDGHTGSRRLISVFAAGGRAAAASVAPSGGGGGCCGGSCGCG